MRSVTVPCPTRVPSTGTSEGALTVQSWNAYLHCSVCGHLVALWGMQRVVLVRSRRKSALVSLSVGPLGLDVLSWDATLA